MSSTSFGDYLISGTQHTNLSQNWRKPRPAGLPLYHFIVQLLGCGPEHIIKKISSVRHKYNQSRSKGMHQVYSGPQSVTNHSTKARTDLRSIARPWINVTRQQRTETCQSQSPLSVEVKLNRLTGLQLAPPFELSSKGGASCKPVRRLS